MQINRNPQKQAPSDGSTCFYGKQKWEELLIPQETKADGENVEAIGDVISK